MGLLGDFTAYVDNLKRRGANTLGDLASDPVGLLSRNLSAFSESLPAAPDSVMPSGSGLLNRPGFQQWGMDVALNAPTMGLLGHTVYHGSPHKFDKFDASKIGTGEGAQAYGYGTYLAERPAVANSYREGLSDRVFSIGEETLKGPASRWGAMNPNAGRENMAMPQKMATYALDSAMRAKSNDPAQDAINHLTKYGKGNKDAQAAIGVIRQWADEGAKVEQGSLYTVDLPDEWLPKMLDWDKPLSQQERIQKILESAGFRIGASEPSKAVDAALWQWQQPSSNAVPQIALTRKGRETAFRVGTGHAVKGDLLDGLELLYGAGDAGTPIDQMASKVPFSHPWVKIAGDKIMLNEQGKSAVRSGIEAQQGLRDRVIGAHGWILGDTTTGGGLLSALTESIRNMDPRVAKYVDDTGLGSVGASKFLRDVGIPGIRYLDGGSRKSGEGTYNYVVFPGMEGLLKILSRE